MQVSDTIDGVAIHLSRAEAEDIQDDLCCPTSQAGDELFFRLNVALGKHKPCASLDQADGSVSRAEVSDEPIKGQHAEVIILDDVTPGTAWGSLASPHVRNNDDENDGN